MGLSVRHWKFIFWQTPTVNTQTHTIAKQGSWAQQSQLLPDKLKDIELKLSDKPTWGKYVRHAYIKNRYVGTVIGQKSLYYIHFHNKIERTAIWADVWKLLHNNYEKAYNKPKPIVVEVMRWNIPCEMHVRPELTVDSTGI